MDSNWLKVEKVCLKLARLPRAFSAFRLAQISDIHMGGWMNLDRFQHVADLVAAQKPDALLITGDFLFGHRFTERSQWWLNDLTKVLSPLAASIPCFAVLGNHDYWTNPEAVRDMLGRSGVTDLTNTVFTLQRAGGNLSLCGVDDIRHGDVRLEDVTAQLSEDRAAILLVHEPDFADISAATGKFDLQVSGHTHGGQIVLPFYGPPILPLSGRKYPSGLYKVRNMFQYTNRGVGVDRTPIRFNCPAEITIFILESLNSEGSAQPVFAKIDEVFSL
ncbi:MAG TPA: metallophosphoesterase [Anaerolineales bacterium]|nr:metallophosphoesterase [Anaerolineales bacterium]